MATQGNGKDRESANLYLFIVTTNCILSYPATRCGSGEPPSMVDEVGTVMDWREKDIVVVREEALAGAVLILTKVRIPLFIFMELMQTFLL